MNLFDSFVDSNHEDITANSSSDMNVDFDFFTSEKAGNFPDTTISNGEKKKKSSKPKVAVNGEIVPDRMVNPIPGASVAEVDYARSYAEGNNLIRNTIMQLDELSSEIKQELDGIRGSKTLKNKYTYIANLTATAGSLLTSKIAAIKEINSTTTQAHNLELSRMKTMKLNEAETNDDMRMMDIYSAFVNTPIGTYTPVGPNIQDLTLGVNNPNGAVSGVEMTVNSTAKPLSPEQNRMRMESNPNIQVVVRYDQSTGQRFFDVMDKNTGASVPNYPRPDNFLLEDTTIDVHTGIARNRNINAVWPLVISGSNTMTINEY